MIYKLVLTKEEIKRARLIGSKDMKKLVHRAQQFAKENPNVPEAYKLKLSELIGILSGGQISLATVKKVVKWGDEPCLDYAHSNASTLSPYSVDSNEHKRRNCPECWQETKKALEEG